MTKTAKELADEAISCAHDVATQHTSDKLGRLINRINDLLSLAQASQARTDAEAVPNGWKLVPMKPTQEMIEAGYDAQGDDNETSLRAAWPAMVNATPPGNATQAAGAQWQPIETAPKVVGRIIGWVDGRARFICWGKASHVPMFGWVLTDQGPEECDLCSPTHWMPLPTSPAADLKKD